jgi:tetratricopeptide (TPR) repeat protein
MPLDTRILNAATSYWRYVAKLLWPEHLAAFYPLPDTVSGWGGVIGGVAMIAATVLLWRMRRFSPALLVGWLWFVGMLVPVIGIVQVGAQAMADRYTYLPSIGLFLVAAIGLSGAVRRFRVPVFAWLAVSLIAMCSLLTWRQIPVWRDTLTLFQHAAAVTDNNYVAHINLGSAYLERGQLNEALQEFQRGLALREDMIEGHYGAAVIYEKRGESDRAIEHYRRVVALRPNHVIARNNVASLLLAGGNTNEAVEELKSVLQIDPMNAEAHYNLGVAYGNANRAQAIEHYGQAIAIRSDYADARNNLAVALAGAGDFEGAVTQLMQVVRLRPNDAEAHFNLGYVLMRSGRTNEAGKEYQIAQRLNPSLQPRK